MMNETQMTSLNFWMTGTVYSAVAEVAGAQVLELDESRG